MAISRIVVATKRAANSISRTSIATHFPHFCWSHRIPNDQDKSRQSVPNDHPTHFSLTTSIRPRKGRNHTFSL
jgi:hypothetical protein